MINGLRLKINDFRFLCLIFGIWCLVFGITSISAQEEEIDIGEVVVTGAKIEKQLKDLPFSANVITEKEIVEKPILRAEEIVKSVPGVHAITPHVGTHGVFVTMRGHALTKQVVSMDGQPINDGFNGYVRWSVIPTLLWDKVEIIRGPFSALYGPYGMGGVINFIPKKILDKNQIKMQIGSFGTHSISLLYGKRVKDNLSFVLFVDEKDTHGYIGDFVVLTPRTTAPSGTIVDVVGWEKTFTVDGKVAYKIGDRGRQYSREQKNIYIGLSYLLPKNQDISLSYLYARQKHGFEGGRTYLRDNTERFIENGNIRITDNGEQYYLTISPLNFLDMEGTCGQDILNLNYNNKMNGNFKFKVFTGLNTRVQKWAMGTSGATSSGGPGRKGTPEGVSKRFGAETEIKLKNNTLIFGGEITLNSGGAKRETLSNWKDINSVTKLEEDAKGKSRITSIYSTFEFIPVKEKLILWAGGRYDNWKKYDGKMITQTEETKFSDATTSRISPKLALLYKPLSNISIRTSYGSGFRVPGPHELYRQLIAPTSVSLGNPDLKPEFNSCWETGIEYNFKNYFQLKNIKVNYYNDTTKDLIYIKTWKAPHPETGQEVNYTQRQNAGKAKTTGFEIELEGKEQLLKSNVKLSWSANASLQNPKITENIADPKIVGKVIPYVPKKMYNLEVTAQKEKSLVSLFVHSRGKVYTRDDNSDTVNGVVGSIDPFTTFNVKFGYKIKNNDIFSIAINNLFDKNYYSMHNQKAPGKNITAEYSMKF